MISQIFQDFLLLYKNFFHWNISKILIYISAAIFAILLGLPFFALAIGIGYFDPVPWQEIVGYYGMYGLLPSTFTESVHLFPGYIVGNSILVLCGFALLISGWLQYLLTASKLYLGYIDDEKLPFFGNIYFNFKIFRRYISYLGWLGLILLLPIVAFFVGVILFFFLFGGESMLSNLTLSNVFFIVVSFWAIGNILLFVYLSLRYGYGYIALVDKSNFPELLSSKSYVGISGKMMTGKNMVKVVGIIVLFGICIYLPLSIGDYFFEKILQNNTFSDIWFVLTFFLFSLSYEMLFVSMYKRILLPTYLEKHQGKEEDEKMV